MRLSVARTRSLLRAYSIASNHSANMSSPEHAQALRPEKVLSESNRKSCIERLQSYKLLKIENYNESIQEAAVLVPLCIYKGELGLLYTQRSIKLTSNGGQVSFPGGMRDKCDANLEETALRETWEELKIPKEKIDVWTTAMLILKNDVNVMPVLAYIGEVEPEQLEINPDEVEEAFVVTLEKLCDPTLHAYTRFKNFRLCLPAFIGGKYRVWGFTGMITHIVLECLLPDVYKHKIQQVNFLRKDTSGEVEAKPSTKQNITLSKI
ncbi:nucleoside diphosphate-linked moiety X motif 8 [Ooceraea biroi]|nr:nucleoside diphosphate-linked moiety X motif 8 [Ooceraea biroi]